MMHIQNMKHIPAIESAHGEIVYELLGAAAGGSQAHSLACIVLPPGKASLKHYHPVAEESYYILSGVGSIEIDGERMPLGPGDAVAMLPRQTHQISNTGQADLVFLAVCAPAWTPDNSVFID